MNKTQLNDIQKSLNWIRNLANKADAESKIEMLALLNSTSQSVIQMTKKLTKPKTRTQAVTRYKERPPQQKQQPAKQTVPPEQAAIPSATPSPFSKPDVPTEPLSNRQAPEQGLKKTA